MAYAFALYVRTLEAVFAGIGLGLAGYVHHCNHKEGHAAVQFNSQNNFLIFVPVFALVSIVYLEISSRWAARKGNAPKVHLVVEFLSTVFYFCGFIVMAKPLASSSTSCHGPACRAMKAEAAFAAFSWVLWTGTTVLALLDIFKNCFGSKKKQQQELAMKEAQMNNSV